ncbi:pentapeptide repeat-containing protein [Nocardia crassostreae]|uniref:pentapeptide repeat-containing protein n=1 Tax=Nocardia crassostreae TaxID=53428 RepID=UPI00147242D7|nr:pentapeptide repeat-containing protein [Nocardia crassostreae]
MTDRFQKAAELLGSDNIDARVAGIYLFERLARDSPADHPVIFTVLTEFLRTSAAKTGCEQAERSSTKPAPPDIRAVLTAIVRRDNSRDSDPLNLGYTCLTSGWLSNASLVDASFYRANLVDVSFLETDLSRAIFFEANLSGATATLANLPSASFVGADLTYAVLAGANLADANLGCGLVSLDAPPTCANLTGVELDCVTGGDGWRRCASLIDARLTGANLASADLERANLTGASLDCFQLPGQERCVNLTGANLAGANLTGADLTGADLTGADLTNIYYDSSTVWPAGFTPPPSRQDP